MNLRRLTDVAAWPAASPAVFFVWRFMIESTFSQRGTAFSDCYRTVTSTTQPPRRERTSQIFSHCKQLLNGTSWAGGRHNIPPPPCKLTFEFLTLKVVFESRVTCATSVPILVLLGLSVLDLGLMLCMMYRRDRQTLDRSTSDAHHRLMPPPYGGGGIINWSEKPLCIATPNLDEMKKSSKPITREAWKSYSTKNIKSVWRPDF